MEQKEERDMEHVEMRKCDVRESSLRKRRKRRKRRKLIEAAVKLVALAGIAVCAICFLIRESGFYFPEIGNVTWQGENIPAGYINEADASLSQPVTREGEELKKQLEKMAQEDSAYADIYENYDKYPQELLSALCNNPEMLSFVQGYLEADQSAEGGFTKEELDADFPLLLQWDKRWGYAAYGNSSIALSGCAPTCLSMVVLALTKNESATPAEVAAYAEREGYYQAGTGTSWSLMTEGCEHFGIHGTQLSLDEGVIRRHLENGEPIICSMRPGDFTTSGHFIVLMGVADQKIMVCDPNSRQRSQVLWEYQTLAPQIKNLWAFTR